MRETKDDRHAHVAKERVCGSMHRHVQLLSSINSTVIMVPSSVHIDIQSGSYDNSDDLVNKWRLLVVAQGD